MDLPSLAALATLEASAKLREANWAAKEDIVLSRHYSFRFEKENVKIKSKVSEVHSIVQFTLRSRSRDQAKISIIKN